MEPPRDPSDPTAPEHPDPRPGAVDRGPGGPGPGTPGDRGWWERRFQLRARGTGVRTEVLAGLTTFCTLSYILFVQPNLMAAAGIPPEKALFATCVASAVACAVMGLFANYPIALAPAMGHNVFFAFVVCGPREHGGLGLTWQQGLAAVFLSGALFLGLAGLRFRERLIEAIPASLQHAIAAGIGLLIALIGLQWGGLVVDHPATLVALGDLGSQAARLTLLGLAVTVACVARRIPGALVIGILATAGAGLALGWTTPSTAVEPGSILQAPVWADLDFAGLVRADHVLEVLFVLFFLDVFDTVGTLVGVGTQAGLMRDGRLPGAGRALAADACGTVVGATLGTSTVTSYVESAAGVSAGGRTGLTALVVGGLFLLALPLLPWFALVGDAVAGPDGALFRPALAPPLIAIGAMMMRGAASIRWNEPTEALPCFLGMIMIPLSFSITDGVAFAVIGLSLASLAVGRPRSRPPLLHALAIVFVLWYAVR